MSDLRSGPGYRHWSPAYGTKISETAGSRVWGSGSYKRRNLETGTRVVAEVDPITRFYFAMGIQGWARRLLGNNDGPRGRGEKGRVLISRGISSLVIDSLCDRAREQDVAVACFYFDFAAQKEHSPASVLGALLKQVVRGLEEVPREIVRACEDQGRVIGGRGPQLADIVKMLQITCSRKRTFVCMDALDECVPGNRVKLLDSLNGILQDSPDTRVFVTGRPQIRPEMGRRLAGRVTNLQISPKRDDIIGYIQTRLDEDADPDAMDSSLKADILKKIPEEISEMYVEATLRNPIH